MLTISVFTVGDEICIGQIVNTNAAWIARQCAMSGWKVLRHSAVGDAHEEIIDELQRLAQSSDVVIITGGLGATHDDRTKYALAEYLQDTIELHQPTLDHLQEILRQRGRELTDRNATQALLPTRCEALQNDVGLAPGLWCSKSIGVREVVLIALPGVPREMQHLMENHVLPRLQTRFSKGEIMVYHSLRTAGIPESSLADQLGDVEEFLEGQELAFLPSSSGVTLRISVQAENRAKAAEIIARIEAVIRRRAGRYIYTTGDEPLEYVVGQLLRERGKTVAIAESCTGGMLGAALTAMSGSSAYFSGGVQCYSNEAKQQLLGVSPDTIGHYGAVSRQTADELARNIRTMFDADFGVSITGIAGPTGGSPEKPVGTVWIGLATAQSVQVHHYTFGNDRTLNRERSVAAALVLLYHATLQL